MPTIIEEASPVERPELHHAVLRVDPDVDPSGLPRPPRLLARLGSLCARRRRWVLAFWAALFVAGIVVGGQVFAHLEESNGNSSAESVRGLELLNSVSTEGGSMVAVVDGVAVSDPAVEAAVEDAAGQLGRIDGIASVVTAYNDPSPRLRSPDGEASLMLISTSRTDDSDAPARQLAEVRAVLADAVPGATIEVGGDLAVEQDQMATVAGDLARGEGIAIPFLLLALLLVFRSFRAALIPLVAGVTTVSGALLLLLGVTSFTAVSSYAVDVIALFGIALAVDYSLLMVNRYREERIARHDVAGAVTAAVGAAGRTIAFSALTVIASLSGLFVFADPTFTSLLSLCWLA
jgi:RND superfamily putative drug exporter